MYRWVGSDRNRTLLRIFMLGNYAVLRRGEIWSLPLRNIHLDEKRIYIMPMDEDSGTDKDEKEIHVKFRPKAGDVTDFNAIPDYLMEFLKDDLESCKADERWFLDKGDRSLWYATEDGITKGTGKAFYIPLISGVCHGFQSSVRRVGITIGNLFIQRKISPVDNHAAAFRLATASASRQRISNIKVAPTRAVLPV